MTKDDPVATFLRELGSEEQRNYLRSRLVQSKHLVAVPTESKISNNTISKIYICGPNRFDGETKLKQRVLIFELQKQERLLDERIDHYEKEIESRKARALQSKRKNNMARAKHEMKCVKLYEQHLETFCHSRSNLLATILAIQSAQGNESSLSILQRATAVLKDLRESCSSPDDVLDELQREQDWQNDFQNKLTNEVSQSLNETSEAELEQELMELMKNVDLTENSVDVSKGTGLRDPASSTEKGGMGTWHVMLRKLPPNESLSLANCAC